MPPVCRDRRRFALLGSGAAASGGFTLLELIVVTAIIVTLAAFAAGGISGARQRAAMARGKAELALLAQALEDYKRHYGDYPQTGSAGQAEAVVTAPIGTTQAQALLFNALTGVYGPANFSTRVNGPVLLDLAKFSAEQTLAAAVFAVPAGSPPAKPVVANCLLDPWGNRYLYFYRRQAPVGASGTPPANPWLASGFVLYSAGPDGRHTAPNTSTGLYSGAAQATGANADNLYADQLP